MDGCIYLWRYTGRAPGWRCAVALHLKGGRSGGAWRGRAEADEDLAAYAYCDEGVDASDAYDPDQEYGAVYGRQAQARRHAPPHDKRYPRSAQQPSGSRYSHQPPVYTNTKDMRDKVWAASSAKGTVGTDSGGKVEGAECGQGLESESEASEAWAQKETSFMKRRRDEELALVSEMGGDLSVLSKDKTGLRTREWDNSMEAMRRDTLHPDAAFVAHKERKRREQDDLIQAAGGSLDKCFVPPEAKLNVFQRDMLARAAEVEAHPGQEEFISMKDRKKKQEEDLVKSFGGNLSDMTSRDSTKLLHQDWDDDAAGTTLPTFKERKEMAEQEALASFGGGLDKCMAKRESALEREKRLSKFNRNKNKDR